MAPKEYIVINTIVPVEQKPKPIRRPIPTPTTYRYIPTYKPAYQPTYQTTYRTNYQPTRQLTVPTYPARPTYPVYVPTQKKITPKKTTKKVVVQLNL